MIISKKVITNETKTFINRMFAMSVKENVLNNLLRIFVSNMFLNEVKLFSIILNNLI